MERFGITAQLQHVPPLDPEFFPLLRFNQAFLEGAGGSLTDQEIAQESGRCLRCDHFGYGIFKGGRETKW